jgi:fatty-acyl-CoA synthase
VTWDFDLRGGDMGTAHTPVTNGDLIRVALERYPTRIAFIDDGREISYAAVADRIGRMIRVLADRGFGPGHGVAILSANRPAAWMAQSAAIMAGGRYTALHPLGSLDDQAFVCDDAEIHTLLFDPSGFEQRALDIARTAGSVKQVLSIGPSPGAEDLLALADAAAATPLRAHNDEADIAWLLYTGGTTGRPKGVRLPHRAFVHLMYLILSDFELPRDVRYLAASPITHAAGAFVLPTLLRGGTVVLQQGFDPDRYLDGIARHGITVTFGVPTMLYALLDHGLAEANLSSLETFMYAASPMSPARMAEALDITGPIFMQYYAQTESASTGTILRKHDHEASRPDRLASCGQPMLGIQVEVQDEDGNEVGAGEVGEICIRGPSVMDGYWKEPEMTGDTLRGGWLHTGDMATKDHDGYLTIVDRRKDMIVSGGFNVFPREVEDVLSTHPAISMAAVVGVPDDKWGEAVKAVVVAKPGASVDEQELIALVRERKGPVYAPKSVEFVDAIPLTAVGKADKKVLRAKYWSGQDRLVH